VLIRRLGLGLVVLFSFLMSSPLSELESVALSEGCSACLYELSSMLSGTGQTLGERQVEHFVSCFAWALIETLRSDEMTAQKTQRPR
jgi:hypothetical protein